MQYRNGDSLPLEEKHSRVIHQNIIMWRLEPGVVSSAQMQKGVNVYINGKYSNMFSSQLTI
jgi:hypothetical protein